ncbi:hypothetical protein BDR26DRAFT_860956 [Obelidium mucronatum]|nr:hypothetical protein BDR26DRAFT_860956 [Obelidium mucronatum]
MSPKPTIVYRMATAACFQQDSLLADKMMKTRLFSNLSGPSTCQNVRESYLPTTNSLHTTAWLGDTLVGYILARTFETDRFGPTGYYPSDSNITHDNPIPSKRTTDTLTINEIVLLKSAEGQGIASKMLDFIVTQEKLAGLTNVEFSVLSTNLASETMFTRFAERHGNSISFGNVSGSGWGSYVDWTVVLRGQKAAGESRQDGKKGIKILSPIMDTVNSLASSDWQCFRDRNALIGRARKNQERNNSLQ